MASPFQKQEFISKESILLVRIPQSGIANEMKTEGAGNSVRWLTVILSIATIVGLVFLYLWLPDSTKPWNSLLKNVIPNLIAALFAIPVVYFIFTRKGIRLEEQPTIMEIEEIIKQNLPPKFPRPQVVDFFDSFRDVPWKEILPEAQVAVDLVVNYWDSWVADHHELLVAFFRKPGSRVRAFVPNPNDGSLLKELVRLYPGRDQSTIQSKIVRTGENLQQALADAGGSENQLEFYYVPHSLSYALQVIDNKLVVLSNYDMFRQNRIGAPAIMLDLSKSEHLANYWNSELKGLTEVSTRIKLPPKKQQV